MLFYHDIRPAQGTRHKKPNVRSLGERLSIFKAREGLAQSSGSLCVEESLPEPGRERVSLKSCDQDVGLLR